MTRLARHRRYFIWAFMKSPQQKGQHLYRMACGIVRKNNRHKPRIIDPPTTPINAAKATASTGAGSFCMLVTI